MIHTSNLYELLNYISPVKYLSSVIITEYDISKANVNALYQAGVIGSDRYQFLCALPKHDREWEVGKMIEYDRYNKVYNTISSGIIEAKKNLFIQNDLEDNEIVRIANDAVFVMRAMLLQHTDFGMMKFIPKGRYTTFVNLGNIVILFSSAMDDLNIDVIGIGDEELKYHSNFMLEFIANLLLLVETNTIDAVISFFSKFYSLYVDRKLSIRYYRELNSSSMYTIKQTPKKMSYQISFLEENDKDKVDISYNANILRELYSIIVAHKTK